MQLRKARTQTALLTSHPRVVYSFNGHTALHMTNIDIVQLLDVASILCCHDDQALKLTSWARSDASHTQLAVYIPMCV